MITRIGKMMVLPGPFLRKTVDALTSALRFGYLTRSLPFFCIAPANTLPVVILNFKPLLSD